MRLYIGKDSKRYIDTAQPIDISIPLTADIENPRAWYVDFPVFEPVKGDGFIGEVAKGGSVNFRNIFFNPHGHGTHTECLGHITETVHSINKVLKNGFYTCHLVTVEPVRKWNEQYQEWDEVITGDQLQPLLEKKTTQALVIRTAPNSPEKKSRNYSATNPPYMDISCIDLISQAGILHLLTDLPSVDRENDGGKLAFHKAFWRIPEDPAFDKTITEFIYADSQIRDGEYLLNLQTAPFENDATPSRPVLFQIFED